MSKYKIGDKVRIVSKWGAHCHQNFFGEMDHWLGKVMTIKAVCDDRYRMCEDKNENLGLGWIWNEHCIAGFAKNCTEKIVITSDGVETLARLYDGKKVVKSATAKCSPDDEFDFAVGAKLAMERLTEETTEKKKKTNTFKVGDIVRIGKTPHKLPAGDFMAIYAGEYGKVKTVCDERTVLVTMFRDKGKGYDAWYSHIDDVELIERNEE